MFKWIRRLAVFVVVLIIVIQCYRIHANIQHVLTYESMVKEVLAEDDIDNTTNVDLVLAMIYTETKGKTDDVMQSVKVLQGDQLHNRSKREYSSRGDGAVGKSGRSCPP